MAADFGVYDIMAGMSKKEIAAASVALSVLIGLFGFLLHITVALADLSRDVGMNNAGIAANGVAIAANSAAIIKLREDMDKNIADLRQEVRKDVGELRKDMGDMREDLGEIRGLLTNHIAGHNHASVITDNAKKGLAP